MATTKNTTSSPTLVSVVSMLGYVILELIGTVGGVIALLVPHDIPLTAALFLLAIIGLLGQIEKRLKWQAGE